MRSNLSLAMLCWLALGAYAFGQEKEYFQKVPSGIKSVQEKIFLEFPQPEFFVQPPIVNKKIYSRRGDLLEEQSFCGLKFIPTRSFEYDYDPATDRPKEFRSFYGNGAHNFLIRFAYNGDGSGTRTLIDQNQDGTLWEFDSEVWHFDDKGRIKKGTVYIADYRLTITYRYHELAFESRNKWGDGKVAEICQNHHDNNGECYSSTVVVFSYDANNNLEEIRYSDKDHLHLIASYNVRGDLVEERCYDKEGSFTQRYCHTNKYERIHGFEVKTEVLKESFYDYEHTDGPPEQPFTVLKYTYEYEFWEEDRNKTPDPKPEGK
ncbi:MAG: hypothetical protein AAB389_03150 [Patescibacteria group bacterium]